VPGHRGGLRDRGPRTVAALRRLLYCEEWIESHALHIYLLHAPDFLGYTSALALAEDRSSARSPRNRSTEWIETALSRLARLQTLSHGW
jgi:Ni,Fe-hydrogenase I large subunit